MIKLITNTIVCIVFFNFLFINQINAQNNDKHRTIEYQVQKGDTLSEILYYKGVVGEKNLYTNQGFVKTNQERNAHIKDWNQLKPKTVLKLDYQEIMPPEEVKRRADLRRAGLPVTDEPKAVATTPAPVKVEPKVQAVVVPKKVYNDRLDEIADKSKVTLDDALFMILLIKEKNQIAYKGNFKQRLAAVEKLELLPKNFKGQETQNLRRGQLAMMLTRLLKLKGSILYNMFPGERYSYKLCAYHELMPQKKSEWESLSGDELLEVIRKTMDKI